MVKSFLSSIFHIACRAAGGHFLSIRDAERPAEAGLQPSLGSVRDSSNNAFAKDINETDRHSTPVRFYNQCLKQFSRCHGTNSRLGRSAKRTGTPLSTIEVLFVNGTGSPKFKYVFGSITARDMSACQGSALLSCTLATAK